ncbi:MULTISPECIES: acetate kinase [Corynebacterium]|uniref:acetate kinase n=1 Tax=Corynebacterium TaxID=1716 RepID=UPI0012454D4E|nr:MULTISPECIES: acetate kinase [Corynebacterium]KAA9220361.1 acetate kinase [Corynebacterium amycolatum]MBC6829550.1 acetate kinase [Corynebacterium sp. LK32]MDK6442680.1 acetate kinase [Corynebacterium amycolatum]
MSRHVLVLNSGSSSIKFQLVDPEKDSTQPPYVSGLVERIGEEDGVVNLKFSGQKIEITEPIADHASGLDRAFALMDEHGVGPESVDIAAVGHRVVHGGRLFSGPELINDEIVGMIRDLIPLAPLHNPANIVGIEESRKLLPDVPHVAVFDTGFFHTMPPAAALYPLNAEVASKFDIRRYGFHGTSHEFVSKQVPDLLNKPTEEINQITLHLGNGASCAAIRGGQAVDTSMGLTPLAGLMMGTRTGDIDPGIIFHLYRNGMSIDEIDNLCNRQSGLKGVSGVNDFRVLQERMDDHDPDAWAAYQMYVHQLRRYIGSYMLILGRLDAITFTAGVGENHVGIRRDSMAELENFGIKIDDERNSQPNDGPRLISADDSKVKVFVVPTNEELAIARYAMSFVE